MIIVQIIHDAAPHVADMIPTAVELPGLYTAQDVQDELKSWGLSCKAFLCGHHDVAFAHFTDDGDSVAQGYVYCGNDDQHMNSVLFTSSWKVYTEHDHMRYLHQQGFTRAVILHSEPWTDNLSCIHFEDVQPQHETRTRTTRQKTPWPSPQPCSPSAWESPFQEKRLLPPPTQCCLEFDNDVLHEFLHADTDWLWHDHTIFDVPDFIRDALDACQKLDRIDRYVVFTDGSSQTKHRHRPPEWIAEHDLSDSWAFVVFGEQYSDNPDVPSKLQFLGVQSQVVLYESTAPHHIGTTTIGSAPAETEALFWAGLWRLQQRNRIPTVFLSDSQMVGGQASGETGSSSGDEPYHHLRAVFQALAACLPQDQLRVEHIRSHTGDPYNEFADWMAKSEGRKSWNFRRQTVDMSNFKYVLKHLWMAVRGQCDVPPLTQTGFAIDPPELPVPHQPVLSADSTSSPITTSFSLSIGTANVRTFYRGQEGFSGKLDYVRDQFIAHGLNILGLQECRTDCGSSLHKNVLRLASGGERGQLGIEIWINLAQPIFTQGKGYGYFKRGDFTVVSYAPRHLLVRAKNHHIDLWLLAAHAPHSGAADQQRTAWWQDISTLVHQYVQDDNIIVMIDANATTGPADGQHIFTKDDKMTPNTEDFRMFLSQHQLCAPSTMEIHVGETSTWISPSDHSEHRIDYVLLPCQWKLHCNRSQNLAALDFGHLGDHQGTAVQVDWQEQRQRQALERRSSNYARHSIAQKDLTHVLQDYQPPPWQTNIEQQVNHLNSHLLQVLYEHCPAERARPKKPFINDDIWNLRSQKLRLQRRTKALRKTIDKEILARCFEAWRKPFQEEKIALSINYSTTLITCAMTAELNLRWTARQLRKRLTLAKRTAIQQAIDQLPDDSSASQILHSLKPIIGTTNHKQKRSTPLPTVVDEQGSPCDTPEKLLNRWVEFFSAMEGGERISEAELRNKWINELEHFQQHEIHLTAEDLPSLTALEGAFRKVREHKAIGEDHIPPELCHRYPTIMARWVFGQLLKLCAHGQESLRHKGGVLVAAWKRKGPQNCCESYRSLLISSHMAKAVHRAVRDQQATLYETFLQNQQLGGRRHVPVSMGVHYIRAAARRARRLHRSHALIFLDLREAFYRVLRPISIGGQIPDALLATVAARLQLPPDALADLQALLQTPSGTERANLPRHLRRALQALHTNTHFRLHGQSDRVHTLIGSRPGDPFADVVFGYMFGRVLSIVEQRLHDMNLLEIIEDTTEPCLFAHDHHASTTSHSMLGPTWMDDLCITVTHDTATGVEHRASLATGVLLETCMAHGVTPNLDKGKSEILFTFRGKGSRKLKVKYFSEEHGKCMPIVTEYSMHKISVVGQYTHLGSIAHHSGLSHRELRRRIAIGNAAFTAHRKVLFQNRSFSLRRRAELFQSIVLSKVVFGMETWCFHDAKHFQYFRSAILRLYRRLLKIAPAEKITDEEVLALTELPDPAHLLSIARLRYLGLLYKCDSITPWAHLRQDVEWTQMVQADLQWLWNLVSDTSRLRDPSQHFCDWQYVLRYHRSYWRRLLLRGQRLSCMRHKDNLMLRKLHHDVLAHLEETGTLCTAPVRPAIDAIQEAQYYGCMACEKRCRTKAGEGAHLFRVHGIVAVERFWMASTTCEACLKEFHSFDKLQVHLRTATACRETMNAKPYTHVPPGFGSRVNEHLRAQHDGLLPVQQADGPHGPHIARREIDRHHPYRRG